MKKLINMLLMALYCPFVCAQVELDGMFDSTIPANQVWDGRYLAYTYQGNSHIYDIQTKEMTLVKGVPVSAISFYKGFYFESREDEFLLRRVGEDSPVLPNKFSWVSQWFGNAFVAWEDNSGPEGGILGTWYDIENGVIARHYLQDIYKAVGFDYQMDFWMKTPVLGDGVRYYSKHFTEGLIPLIHPKTKLYGFYDSALKRVIEHKYLEADPFFEGLAAVKGENELWGFINPLGEQVIPLKFRSKPGRFSNGLARIGDSRSKIGYINQNGELAIPVQYNDGINFYKGKTIVWKGLPQKMIFLDKYGLESEFICQNCTLDYSEYVSPAYSQYFPNKTLKELLDEGLAIFKIGFEFYILNIEGERVFPENFGLLKDLLNGQLIVVEGGNLWQNSDQRFFVKDIANDLVLIKLNLNEF